MNKNGRLNIANEVNTDQAVAWAKGYFQFKNDDVATIMRQIARWYDVDIVYKSKIPAGKYTGKISRSTQASEVLKMLQLGGIKYEIEGNRLIIQ
jgi:ferric-dicitrate binding protein FerR (iron transport regulator)